MLPWFPAEGNQIRTSIKIQSGHKVGAAMKLRRFLTIVVLLTLCIFRQATANAQSTRSEGAQRFVPLGDFKLQNGAVIRDEPTRRAGWS